MSAETYWLSRITPRPDIGYRQLVSLGGLDPYRQHQTLWKLFDVPRNEKSTNAEFLFRAEQQDGMPVFYVLSRRALEDHTGLWRIEPKRYAPEIREGDRLSFKLRVNPIVIKKVDRSVLEGDAWHASRTVRGDEQKNLTKKRVRHDVVMDAKHRMNWKFLSENERPSLAHLAHEAGILWLRGREPRVGCRFEEEMLRVDGYRPWRQFNGKGIALSTLDFEGRLMVSDAEKFKNVLIHGIGPAKAFGCGLMLVRRV